MPVTSNGAAGSEEFSLVLRGDLGRAFDLEPVLLSQAQEVHPQNRQGSYLFALFISHSTFFETEVCHVQY